MREARAADLAMFVVNFGLSPAEYRALTRVERDALITEFKRVHKR